MSNVMAFLSILVNHPFCIRIRDVRVWSPNPWYGFLWKSSFQSQVKPSPTNHSSLRRIKVSRKVRLFTWQGLHGRLSTFDRLVRKMSLMIEPSIVFFVERWRKTRTVFFGIVTF